MGFKTGALVGLAAGYYLGAKAGRERYEQINTWIDHARNSGAVTAATEKAKEIIDDGADLTVNAQNN
jgi:membrane protein DedA with SNARE-associated domain